MYYDEPQGPRTPTWFAACAQILSIALMLASPWWYGAASWATHAIAYAVGMVLFVIMAFLAVSSSDARSTGWWPNGLTWALAAFGCFALWQAQASYEWSSSSERVPPSVQMQRWALGYAPVPSAIAEDLVQPLTQEVGTTGSARCGWDAVPEEERRLALSVEPSTTRAAAGSLFLAALLIWVGSATFSRKGTYPILLMAITLLGSAIALFGILNVLMPSTREWLGLERANSFATFVSKNSGGAFLNVCLAASIGLILWTSYRARKLSDRRRRRRHRNQVPSGWNNSILDSFREFLANLDAAQIAAFLALVLIAAAVLQSLSRGAAVSGLAAAAGTLALIVPGKRSGLALLGALLIAAVAMGFMVFFQMDERILTRLETLGDIDLESESRAGRLYIWDVSWKATQFYSWLGSGLGTFHYASLPFQRPAVSGWYYHAESIYLEVLVTLGYLGGIALVFAMGAVYLRLRSIYVSERFREFAPIQAAGTFLFLSQSIHSAVDFALILPGVFIPATLLMGAALGAGPESFRVLQNVKRRSLRRADFEGSDGNKRGLHWIAVTVATALALGGTVALYYCQQATLPLAVAETMDRKFQQEDRLPVGERMERRLDALVSQAAAFDVSISRSPQLLRLIAESLCYDDRMRQWERRPSSADPKVAWNETSPFLVRLALDRVEDSNREEWLESIGGQERLDGLSKASKFYARSRAQSPLDWHALWGHLHTSLECSTEEMAIYAPVMQRTISHLPQLLTSASIFFNGHLSVDDRIRIWKIALRTSPSASLGIARIMTTQYPDGAVPVDIFPDNVYYLYKMAREVFTKSSFPITHEALCDRALKLIPTLADVPTLKRSMLTADVARESDRRDLEIESLSKYLQFKPDDTLVLARLIELQIKSEQWENARDSLRKLRQFQPEYPKLGTFEERISSGSKSR
jgi:O-antigen ligase